MKSSFAWPHTLKWIASLNVSAPLHLETRANVKTVMMLYSAAVTTFFSRKNEQSFLKLITVFSELFTLEASSLYKASGVSQLAIEVHLISFDYRLQAAGDSFSQVCLHTSFQQSCVGWLKNAFSLSASYLKYWLLSHWFIQKSLSVSRFLHHSCLNIHKFSVPPQ